MDDDPLLTAKEAAAELKLHERTIKRWIGSGKLRGVWLGSDRAGWRVRRSELLKVQSDERPPEPTRQLRFPRAQDESKKLAA